MNDNQFLSAGSFLIENTVEYLVEPGFVGDNLMELFQVLCVVAPRNPDLQIALGSILLMQVLNCPLIMSFSVELRIISQSILDGAPDYRLRLDEAVSFGNQQPITVARLF